MVWFLRALATLATPLLALGGGLLASGVCSFSPELARPPSWGGASTPGDRALDAGRPHVPGITVLAGSALDAGLGLAWPPAVGRWLGTGLTGAIAAPGPAFLFQKPRLVAAGASCSPW